MLHILPYLPVHGRYTVDSEQLSPGGDHVGGGEGIAGHREVIVLVLVLGNDDTAGMLEGHLIQREPREWLQKDGKNQIKVKFKS